MNHFQQLYQVLKLVYHFNNSLCGKLVSLLESPIKFGERFKVTSVPYFVSDFNLLSCELDNFTFNVLY